MTTEQTESDLTDPTTHTAVAAEVEQQLLGQAQVQYLLGRAAELNAALRAAGARVEVLEAEVAEQAEQHAAAIEALTATFEQQLKGSEGEKCDTGPHDHSQTGTA